MNAIVPVQQSAGLVPTSMSEAMKLAEMMAGAKLVPAALQKSPADCLMVIQQAVRWQMDPFAVAQECSVIQGKLMHSGKLVAAVVNSRGNLAERLSFSYDGTGDNRTIIVSGRMSGESAPRTVVVTLKDAKTNNRVWQTQPDQQLMYHGCRVWARRHTPELMLGVYSPEEFDEAAGHASVAANGRPQPAPLALASPSTTIEHDPETGEVGPRVLPMPQYNGGDDWIAFGQSFLAAVRAAKTPDEVMAWGSLNQKTIEAMKTAAPKVYARLIAAIEPPPAVEPETLDIPPELKRTAKPKPATAADVFDGAAWLKDLEGQFAACNTGEEFVEVEAKVFRANIEKALAPDVKKANKIREEHYTRITQAADAA
jgi:hypothetical protein